MSFFSINTDVIRKASVVFFTIMAVSWLLMLALIPFGGNETEAGPGISLAGAGVLFIIYATAYVSPFVAALYSWFWVATEKSARSRTYSVVVAIIATGLSIAVVYWAIF